MSAAELWFLRASVVIILLVLALSRDLFQLMVRVVFLGLLLLFLISIFIQ